MARPMTIAATSASDHIAFVPRRASKNLPGRSGLSVRARQVTYWRTPRPQGNRRSQRTRAKDTGQPDVWCANRWKVHKKNLTGYSYAGRSDPDLMENAHESLENTLRMADLLG
jgi:hypothetical protein